MFDRHRQESLIPQVLGRSRVAFLDPLLFEVVLKPVRVFLFFENGEMRSFSSTNNLRSIDSRGLEQGENGTR